MATATTLLRREPTEAVLAERGTVPSPETSQRAQPSVSRRLGHVGALDGLRGLAFLTVLSYHLDQLALPAAGYVGVDLFFGLSGFLITALLVERFGPAARRSGHGVARSLGDFYARRARRLLPALVLFLACYLLVWTVAGGSGWFDGVPGQTWVSPPVTWADMVHAEAGALGYFSNLAITFGWVWGQGAPIGHLWTLAVEGQFYVAWGLLLVGVLLATRGRRRAGIRIGGALALGLATWSIMATVIVWHGGTGGHYAYFATWTRGQGLLLGAAAGLWWCSGGAHRLVSSLTGRMLAAAAMTACIGWLVGATVLVPSSGPAVPAVSDMAAISAACALLVVLVAVRPASIMARVCRIPLLRYVGRRSYALYLWHYPLLSWFRNDGAIGDAVAVGLAFVAAELSWRLVEHPVLSRGRFLPRGSRSTPDPADGLDRGSADAGGVTDRPPLDRLPSDRQPLDRPLLDRQPLDRLPPDRLPPDRQPLDRQPSDRQPVDRSQLDRPLPDRPLSDRQLVHRPPVHPAPDRRRSAALWARPTGSDHPAPG